MTDGTWTNKLEAENISLQERLADALAEGKGLRDEVISLQELVTRHRDRADDLEREKEALADELRAVREAILELYREHA